MLHSIYVSIDLCMYEDKKDNSEEVYQSYCIQ